MIKNRIAKIAALTVGMTLALGASSAGAQTIAELQAQINALMAQLAALQGGTAGTAACTFTRSLTVGARGTDVTCLQDYLTGTGHFTYSGGSTGYFGPITKAAVAAWQAANSVAPAVGYFGPISQAKYTSMAGTPGTPGTPPVGITTPGVEGTITVTSNNSGLASTVYEGDSMVSILGMNVEAKTSDMAVQRIKINLGTNSKIYNDGYSKLYVTDGSNVLASVDLNSSTVVKEGSTYFITIAGFSFVVPKDTKKQLVVKADVRPSIDSADRTTLSSIAVSLPIDGVRAIDGAGINQYGPSSASTVTKTVTFSADLAETATLKLSLNNSSPKKTDVVADAGSTDDELDKLTTLVFDVKAEKDNVLLTDIRIGVVKSGGGAAVAQTAYLFDGSTELDNAAVTGGLASFTDVDLSVSKDTTKTYTVKIDVRDADGTVANFVTSASTTAAADLVGENTKGDSVTVSGSATGYSIGVRNVGAEVTLVSKSISSNGVPQTVNGSSTSTSTISATFNVKIKAVGGDLLLGTVASTTNPVFTQATSFLVYRNGADAAASSAATSTSFTIPSTCTTGVSASCTLAEGSEVTFPVTFQIQGRTIAGAAFTNGLYSVGLEALTWINSPGAVQTTNFMAGENDWRTADVSFP